MSAFINKHSIKIQLGVAVMVLLAVVKFSASASSVMSQVEDNAEDVVVLQINTADIPLMRSDIEYIRSDISEIKNLLIK